MRYQVLVGNVGTVYDGPNEGTALAHAREYIAQSKTGRGRVGGEDVTVFRDDEPFHEYRGSLQDWEAREGDE